ncbi:MAG: type II toxin-antitoxin system PemK/MazF family toxin [Opitutales bacterium]
MTAELSQWDVVRVRIRPTDKDPHPAVVISRTEVCRDPRKLSINILYGSTKRPATAAGATDVVLNGADGLDRATAFNCDHLFTVAKASIESQYGSVGIERRRAISRTLHRAFALLA